MATSGSSTDRRAGRPSPTRVTTAGRGPHRSRPGEARRHSMFILDMRGQGVEIRPIHQIDGEPHFNEELLRCPHPEGLAGRRPEQRLEPRDDADVRTCRHRWRRRRQDQPTELQDAAQGRRATVRSRSGRRDQMMEIWSMETCKSLVAMKTRDELKAGKTPGPGGGGAASSSARTSPGRCARRHSSSPVPGQWRGIPRTRAVPNCSGSCSTASSRASPVVPTRSSATSSATVCRPPT